MDRFCESVDLFFGVCGGEGDAEAGGAFGDGGVADGGDEEAGVVECLGGGEGGLVFAEDEGDDGRWKMDDGRWKMGDGGLEVVDVFLEFLAELVPFFRLDEVEGGMGGGDLGGGWGGGVDEGAGFVDEEVDDGAGGGEVSAGGAEGFAESAHLEVDVGLEVEFFGEAEAVGAEDAEGVGFIDHEEGVVLVFEGDDFLERGEVAVHGEDGFGDDDDAGTGGRFFAGGAEDFFEFVEVVVGEDTEGGAAEACGVDEGGVAEFVEDEGVVFPGKGGEGAEGGGVAIGEGEGGFGFFGVGEFFLELVVEVERAADESGGGGAGSVGLEGGLGGDDEGGVVGEAEVVVRGKVGEFIFTDEDAGGICGDNTAEFSPEVLLVELTKFGVGVAHGWRDFPWWGKDCKFLARVP